jgi:hypothetical protein
MRLTARFYVRGGIFHDRGAQHASPGWKTAALPDLDIRDPQASFR